jgi:hypothetical protein
MLRLTECSTSATSSQSATTSLARHVSAGRAIACPQRMSETNAAHLTNGFRVDRERMWPGEQLQEGRGSSCKLRTPRRHPSGGEAARLLEAACGGALRGWRAFHRMSAVWAGVRWVDAAPSPTSASAVVQATYVPAGACWLDRFASSTCAPTKAPAELLTLPEEYAAVLACLREPTLIRGLLLCAISNHHDTLIH